MMDNSFEKLINRVLDGRYKIENVVGIGGMAYVLKATDLKDDNKTVAIKILNEEYNGDENAVKRFVNESEAVKMVDSPYIVKIFDIAISDNLNYIVMEFIDGITLKDYIDKVGALGWKEAVHYVRQILKALSHAHEKGIIHRDIKPQNIMLLRDGKVKVTDFGIAKTPTSEPLTMTDKAIGTVNYIIPEQASGGKVDEKSDLYSVGVMLYEMLTGTLPFKADSPVAVAMMQVSEEPVSPREINPQIPVGLEQIVLKSMNKSPEERFGCASSMEKALEYFTKNPAVVFTGVPTSVGGNSAGTLVGRHPKDDEDEENERKSMFPIILGVTAAFIVVCIIVGIVLLVSSGVSFDDGFAGALDKIFNVEENNSDKNNVPLANCIGEMYTEELKSGLEEKGYRVVIKDDEDRSKPNNMIIRQDPDPETTPEIKNPLLGSRRTLTLYVNRIPGSYIKMPDCLDMSIEDAKAMIVDAFGGAVAAADIKETEVFREGTKGNVFECQPSPGTPIDLENIPAIKLYICNGVEPEEVVMPSVVGLPKDEAYSILKENKITYTETREYSDAPSNTVLRTSVEEGEKFMNDVEVIVYVSEKNRSESFIMPDCIGTNKNSAIVKIASRFRISEDRIAVVEEYNDNVAKDKVFATEPAAETMVLNPAETSFVVYVSRGRQPKDAEMPYVEGKPLSEAGILLDNAGFGNISTDYVDSSAKRNTVLYANYSVGAIISQDTEIVLMVSNGSLADDEGGNNDASEDSEDTSNMDELLDMAGRQ